MEQNKLQSEVFIKDNVTDFTLITLGSFIQAVGMNVFMIPAELISGGISGLAQVINHYNNWPIGVMTFLGNVPILLIGWRYLGRLKFALRTVWAIISFSFFTDLLYFLIPNPVLTNDVFLNTIFGAVILGLGFGLVYKGSGTSGGSDIIGRILNVHLGMPLTASYLATDSVSILLGAIAFGWERALYGLVAVYVSGVAAEMISEGSNMFRDTMIITDKPQEIGSKVISELERTVTYLEGTGGYTGAKKTIVYCVISRNEVNKLKKMVAETDPKAFMIVGQANEVLGEGFRDNKPIGD